MSTESKPKFVFLSFAAILYKLQELVAPSTTGSNPSALVNTVDGKQDNVATINAEPQAVREAAVASLADCVVCCTQEEVTAAEHMLLYPYAMDVLVHARNEGRLLLQKKGALAYSAINAHLTKLGIPVLTGGDTGSLDDVPLRSCVPDISDRSSGYQTLWAACPLPNRKGSPKPKK